MLGYLLYLKVNFIRDNLRFKLRITLALYIAPYTE